MKQKLFTFKSGLLTKLLLSFTLLLAGLGNIWADTTIVDGNVISSGWNNGGAPGKSCSQTSSTGVAFYTTTGGQLTAQGNYSWHSLHSSNKIEITTGQTIVLCLKGLTSSAKYELSYSTDNSTFSNVKNTIGSTSGEFVEYEIENVVGSFYLYIWTYGINIQSLIIKDAGAVIYDPAPAPLTIVARRISYDSATLEWRQGGALGPDEPRGFQIYVSTEEGEPDDNDESIEFVSGEHDGSYNLENLEENITYHAYIRAVCGDVKSDWLHTSFKTPEQYPTPTDLTASNYAGAGTEATISWTDGDGDTPTSWQLRYNTSDFSPAGGEGTLIDNIDDNTKTLSGLTPGGTYYVSVRACYGVGLYSSWTDKISFTTIAAWETFSDGIPSTWYNQDSHWRTNRSGFEGMASATSTSSVLRTARLYAEAGQTISFDVTVVNSGTLTARYYKDSRSSYTTIGTYTTSGTQTFTAPTTGFYWIQFTGRDCAIDNINGFGPSDTDHLMELGTKTMSSTGTVGGDYTATVNIRELGGTGETFTAELWYDDEKVAELEDQVIAGNRDMAVQITFTPMEENSSTMYAKIIYDGGTKELTTATTNVTFSNTDVVLDENSTDRPGSSVYGRVLHMKYAAKNGWNTICVPFILNETYLDQIFGSDWKAYAFSGYSDGAISFQKKSSSFVVSTPYLIYAENANDVDKDKIYLKSASITISNYSSANMTVTKNNASFIGTLDPKAKGTLEGYYGVTGDGHIAKGGSGAFMRGYRAYFSLPEAEVHSLVFDGEGGETDLGFVKIVDENAKDVYTLTGQKVQKGRKGIYIVNGKKVVIK